MLPALLLALICVNTDVPRVLTTPGGLHAGDFDGDGNADVLANAGVGGISILYGKGDGTFEPPIEIFAEETLQLAVADFDGDGRPDILSASATALSLRVPIGPRAFGAPRVLGQGSTILATGDFTNDGRRDIVINTVASPTPVTLVNDGDGRFTQAAFSGTLVSPAAGDFDGDGNADLASLLAPGITILYGDGRGKFGTRYAVLTQNGIPFAVDLNGDGRDELVALRRDQNEILVMNAASVFTVSERRYPAAHPESLVAADYNSDGWTDVAVLGEGRVRIYLNDGAGGLVTNDALLGPPSTSQLASADFNRDGFADLLIGAGGGFAVSFGRGDGTFRFPRTPLLPDAHLIGAADLDGDAVDELLVLSNERLYASRGSAFEEVPVDVATSFRDPRSFGGYGLTGDHPVAAGDVLAAAGKELVTFSGTFVRTFSRDASAQWYEAASWHAGFGAALTTANFNEADALDEIAVVADGDLQVRRADGTLLFDADLPSTSSASVHRIDADGDGHVDLLAGGSGRWVFCGFTCGHGYAPANDGYVLLFRGRGDGTFDPATQLVTNTQILDLTPGDFNGDRRLDFVLTRESGDVSAFLSDGAGGFSSIELRTAAAHAGGDVNGDGIDDLVLQSGGALTFFLGSTAGLVEDGTYPGTDVPYIVRRGPRSAAVLYTLPPGEAGVIESDCRIGRRRIVRH